MIVKILSKSQTFHAVKYNIDKIRKHKGQLLVAKNFGVLTGLSEVRPEDYKNYLKALSARNPKVSKPQFHAVLSAKGHTADQNELTTVAEKWLQLMGYAFQPYLIISHNDTGNAHVHIVSTRIDREGKKISSAFEKVRAVKDLDKVLGRDRGPELDRDIALALSYHFSTKAQFFLILEKRGYHISLDGRFAIVGRPDGQKRSVDLAPVESRILEKLDTDQRRQQLKALFYKYGAEYPTTPEKEKVSLAGGRSLPGLGFTSPFAQAMKSKFGIELVFHFSGDKPPYGYTIIDHHEKNVFKGGDILPLKALLALSGEAVGQKWTDPYPATTNIPEGSGQTFDPTVPVINRSANDAYLESDTDAHFKHHDPQIGVNIADDIDDESINGRNRRRKRKARTNSR